MNNSIQSLVPFLVTGSKSADEEQMFKTVRGWDEERMKEEIAVVESRYKSCIEGSIGDYTWLRVFTEITKTFQRMPYPGYQWRQYMQKAQNRVLHYHNIQYEKEKK